MLVRVQHEAPPLERREHRPVPALQPGSSHAGRREEATDAAAGVAIDTYDDHRMAMGFSLAALGGVSVRINDPQCVAKTFPDYFKAFSGITQ